MPIWSKEEDTFLIENYYKIGILECSILLNRKKKSISYRAKKLNVIKATHYWSEKEISFLKENYSVYDIKSLSSKLDRSIDSIRYMAGNLNLKVDKSLHYKRLSESKLKNHKKFEEFKVNPNIFLNIETSEIAYILGMLWSDGYLYKNTISLWLKEEGGKVLIDVFKRTGEWNHYYRELKGRKDNYAFIQATDLYLIF